MNCIYVLIDPVDGEVRYVGKTNNPKRRLAMHCNSKYDTHSSRWVHRLKRRGLKPEMLVIQENLTDQDWPEAEKRWIAHYKAAGARLTNITEGGHHVVTVKHVDHDDDDYGDCYTIPNFTRIIAALMSSIKVRSLPPTLRRGYSEVIGSASKTDTGLISYKKAKDVKPFIADGLLTKMQLHGQDCFLVLDSDKYVETMRESTGILCQ